MSNQLIFPLKCQIVQSYLQIAKIMTNFTYIQHLKASNQQDNRTIKPLIVSDYVAKFIDNIGPVAV